MRWSARVQCRTRATEDTGGGAAPAITRMFADRIVGARHYSGVWAIITPIPSKHQSPLTPVTRFDAASLSPPAPPRLARHTTRAYPWALSRDLIHPHAFLQSLEQQQVGQVPSPGKVGVAQVRLRNKEC
ncbi:hypothetical protein J6590_019750 [Homalodisca vitripennis]|nr:hypothetical protein J6590_019750 [Homalodisca vitripennis]